MTHAEMESLVRDVCIHYGFPFEVVSVAASPAGWTVSVRGHTGRTVVFTVHDGRPLAMRVAIQERLQAES
jgi:hypothetical protein